MIGSVGFEKLGNDTLFSVSGLWSIGVVEKCFCFISSVLRLWFLEFAISVHQEIFDVFGSPVCNHGFSFVDRES